MLTFALTLTLSAASVRCEGPGAEDAAAVQTQKNTENGSFYGFAVAHWGTPLSCTAKVRRDGAQTFGTWTWRFKGGVTFSHDVSPPEYVVSTFSFERGLDDARVVDALFALDDVKSLSVRKKEKPALEVDADAGTTTERHWSTDEGFNAAIDVVRKAGKVVLLRFHIAL
jgi:hypothetical protein